MRNQTVSSSTARLFGSTALRTSIAAAGVMLVASPAQAQTETQQSQAQQTNTAVECSTIADAAERQLCLDTQGETSISTQGAPPEGTIVVTGSRIPRPNFDTIQPSVVIDSAAIEQRGFETVFQALNELPVFGVPGNSPVGAGQQGAFGTGQSFVNFFGLGDQRTLVLVNGRRFISSNTSGLFGATFAGQQVDLGQINTKLIDRVETIAIGGAPIYGSDAIAGTVNVVLKKDYQGLDLDGQYGVSSRGDAPNWRVRALAGMNFLDGRANLTASAEYNKGEGLLWNDRKNLREALFYDVCPPDSQFSQCVYSNQRLPFFGGESGTPLIGGAALGLDFPLAPDQDDLLFGPGTSFGVLDPNGNDLMFSPSGGLIPIDYGAPPGGPDNSLETLNRIGGNGFNIFDVLQILSDTERYNANLIGHYDITDNVRLFGEAWYGYSKSTQLRNQPVFNCGCFSVPPGEPAGNVILSIDNPFLTDEQRAIILDNIENNPLSDQNFLGVPQDYFYLTRANTDLYPGVAPFRDRLTRFVLGLEGQFALMGRDWNWEVVGNRGRSHTRGRELQVNEQNFQNAINAVTDENGNIVCAPHTNSPFPTLSSECVPLNLFGRGLSSQAARDYVLSKAGGDTVNTQTVFTADVTGPLLKLPGGDLSFALGAETRKEKSDFEPSAFYRGGPDPDPTVDSNGDGDPANDLVSFYQGVPIQPVHGEFRTKEIFGEITGDVVSPSNAIPGIYSLDFQAAGRYVHHSVAGGDVTWTVGSRYAPVRDIALRGNYTKAIRAPSIQEATIPTSTFFSGATDPCDADNLTSGPDPATRQANCASTGPLGVPAGYEQNPAVTFLQGIKGNPDLKNERSSAFSVGTVVTPTFIPRLTFSVDYIKIRLRDAITNFSATQVLNACYDSTSFPDNEFCAFILRSSTNNQLSFVNTSFFNADELRYRGIVASWDYKVRTPFLGAQSAIGISGSYQHLIELSTRAGADNTKVDDAGKVGYPKDSAVLNVNYANGPFSFLVNFNYTGPVTNGTIGTEEPDDFREHNNVDSVIYTNIGARVELKNGFRIFADIENVLDKGIPFPIPANGGSVTYFPGEMGRFFRVGAGVHF